MSETETKQGRPSEIYALTDPRDGIVRYIGKANNSKARLKGHLLDSKRKQTPVYCWIRQLLELGLSPVVSVLETSHNWQEAERRLIAQHRAGGLLLNVADGGNQPFCPTDVRAANGKANAAKRDKRKWALLLNLADGLRRGHVSEETKEKMRSRPDVFGQFSAYLSKGNLNSIKINQDFSR